MMSVGRRNEKKTSTRTEVICIDKDEQAEMGNWQNTQSNSQIETEETVSEDLKMVDSPILFPNHESSQNSQMIESENNAIEDDCLEIIDDIKPVKKPIDQNHTSSAKPTRGKISLSLGKKRKTCQQDEADCRRNNGVKENAHKQRRLIKEEEEKTVADEEKPEASSEKEASTVQPIILLRSYNCTHTVCRTLQEADNMDQYFAPPGVEHSLYCKVIVRKFESYRQRLHHAQSRLLIRQPSGDPIQPMVVVDVPPPQRRPAPSHSRTTRASVLRKNIKEVNTRTTRDRKVKKDSNELPADILGTTSKATEAASSDSSIDEAVEVELIHDYNQNKQTTTPPPSPEYSYNPSLAGNDDDVVETMDNNDDVSLFEKQTIQSSRILPRLSEKLRRAILEESDDEECNFSVRRSPLTTPVETKKQESVIVSANEADTNSQESTSQQTGHECPMCFKMFPKDRIETHAAICLGLSGTSTRSTSRDMMDGDDDGIIDNTTIKQSKESAGSVGSVEDGEMSPTIKTRTPTKVKELKLLTPSVAVRNLANDFFSQPQTSERVQMFGVNVTLSPKTSRSFSDTKKCQKKCQKKCEESVERIDDAMATKDESRSGKPNFIESTRNLLQKSCPTNEPKKNKTPWEDLNSDEDFMSLICDSSDSKIVTPPNDKLPKPIHLVTSILSSDEDSDTEKVVKALNDKGDDLNALDLMASSYKGRKRKEQNAFATNRKKRPKKHLNPEEDNSLEYCSFCGKYIPEEIFGKHMEEEIAQQGGEMQREDSDVSVLPSHSSNERHSPVLKTKRGSSKSRKVPLIGKNGRQLLLPDLADEIIPQVNDDSTSGSPLKTYTPLDRGLNSNGDYFEQFAFMSESSKQAKERQPKKRTKLFKVVKRGQLRRKKY